MPEASPPVEVPSAISLPLGLLKSLDWLPSAQPSTVLDLHVPSDYEAQFQDSEQPEVFAIQRLLTLARKGMRFRVIWSPQMAEKATRSASLYPLLAILISSGCSDHFLQEEVDLKPFDVSQVQKVILKHKFSRDLFSESEVLICKDGSGTRPTDLYTPMTTRLRPREDFETLVLDIIAPQTVSPRLASGLYERAMALGNIIAELVENTDIHGRFDSDGKPLSGDSLRGVILKRIKVEVPVLRPRPTEPKTRIVNCLELSVFDSGIGYFSSYTRGLDPTEATLDIEWQVLHNCLERHYFPEIPDSRIRHRSMGLFEVLRAIQLLTGRIEVRTGRLYAYRTFLEGQLQVRMEPRKQFSRIAWPQPILLDIERQYRAKPSEHEALVGASILVIVPLD